MAPEYNKVFVPHLKEKYFEYALKNIGGTFGTKETVPGEIPPNIDQGELTARWTTVTAPVRQLVARFAQPQTDPIVEAGIDTGVSKLITDTCHNFTGSYDDFDPTAQQIDASKTLIRAALAGKFMEDLPKDVPDYIRLLRTKEKGYVLALSHNIGRKRFSPREIAFLVERYGLSTGLGKNYLEIAKEYGVSAGFVQGSMTRLFAKVHRFLQPRRVELFQL